MVTKMEQMPSRRRANQREVVRNRNQAAVQHKEMCYSLDSHSSDKLYVSEARRNVEADLSAGPDGHRRFSGTSPLLQRLGSSTDPEEMRTGGRRLDSELQMTKRRGWWHMSTLLWFASRLCDTHWWPRGV